MLEVKERKQQANVSYYIHSSSFTSFFFHPDLQLGNLTQLLKKDKKKEEEKKEKQIYRLLKTTYLSAF